MRKRLRARVGRAAVAIAATGAMAAALTLPTGAAYASTPTLPHLHSLTKQEAAQAPGHLPNTDHVAAPVPKAGLLGMSNGIYATPEVVKLPNNVLSIFAMNAVNGNLETWWQTAPGSNWQGPVALGGDPTFFATELPTKPSVVVDQAGMMHVFLNTPDGLVEWQQTSVGSGFTSPTFVSQPGWEGFGDAAAVVEPGGDIDVVGSGWAPGNADLQMNQWVQTGAGVPSQTAVNIPPYMLTSMITTTGGSTELGGLLVGEDNAGNIDVQLGESSGNSNWSTNETQGFADYGAYLNGGVQILQSAAGISVVAPMPNYNDALGTWWTTGGNGTGQWSGPIAFNQPAELYPASLVAWNGAMINFGAASNGAMSQIWQTGPGSTWDGPVQTPGSLLAPGAMTAIVAYNNAIVAFGITPDGQIAQYWQPAAGSNDWQGPLYM